MTATGALPSFSGADPMLPRAVRIASRREECPRVWTIESEAADGKDLPGFRPGQFHMLWAFGAGEVPISASGDPANASRLVHTVRTAGTVTRALGRLEPGDVLGLRGPFGRGWPVEAARGHDVVLVGGGVGLAPLRPALLALLGSRGDYGTVHLLYGARSPQDILYAEELRGEYGSRVAVQVTVDTADRDWTGPVGVVTRLLARASFDPSTAFVFVCGPEVMMRYAAREALDRGVGAERVHVALERNMQCGVGFCGHCQLGPRLLCRDGPVIPFSEVQPWLATREM